MSMDWLRRVFIEVLAEEKPEHMHMEEHMESVFCVASRAIALYKVALVGDIPGTYLEGGIHPVEGLREHRKLRRGQVVTARKDHADNFFDVDAGGHCFRLTEKEWRSFRKQLNPVKGQEDVS